jgi:DNA-binding CsgD family transcriptional regulator
MSLTLNSRELAQLQAALETILTPINHSSPEAWGRAVMRDVQALLSGDQAFFALPLDGSVHLFGSGESTDQAAIEYEKDYWQTDFVISDRRKALGLEVHHQDQLYREGELERDVLYNEWCVPNRLLDTLGMAVDVSNGPIPAGVNVYHNRSSPEFGERGRLLMEVLAPAFKASVRSYRILVELSDSACRLIDAIPAGVFVVDTSGNRLYQNRALDALYLAEPDRQRLELAVREIAGGVVRGDAEWGVCAYQRCDTTTNSYELRLTRSAGLSSLPGAAGMVIVESVYENEARRRTESVHVRERFGLTPREVEVALLLAKRLTTGEIASTLGVSTHTVRHHTESVFAKTGVSRRSSIAALFDP